MMPKTRSGCTLRLVVAAFALTNLACMTPIATQSSHYSDWLQVKESFRLAGCDWRAPLASMSGDTAKNAG